MSFFAILEDSDIAKLKWLPMHAGVGSYSTRLLGVRLCRCRNGRAFLLSMKPSAAALPKGSDPQAEHTPQLEWR